MSDAAPLAAAQERLIVALDLPRAAEALVLCDRLGERVVRYKVGLELFIAEGLPLVRALCERGKRIFLDLKLHDIPETVGRAIASIAELAGLGVELVTVHAAGGRAMLERAVAAARRQPQLRVVAVTVLTSLDAEDLGRDGHAETVEALVVRRAKLAIAAGCAGVIASPNEVAALRLACGTAPLIITPGIRLAGPDLRSDQKRIATARAAVAAGASAVVVGRPIRDAADPAAVAAALLAELA